MAVAMVLPAAAVPTIGCSHARLSGSPGAQQGGPAGFHCGWRAKRNKKTINYVPRWHMHAHGVGDAVAVAAILLPHKCASLHGCFPPAGMVRHVKYVENVFLSLD